MKIKRVLIISIILIELAVPVFSRHSRNFNRAPVSLILERKESRRAPKQKQPAPKDASTLRGKHVIPGGKSAEALSVSTLKVNGKTQVDIRFSTVIDPRSTGQVKLFINNKEINPKPAFLFNREGNVLRFVTEIKTPFTVSISNLKAINGSPIPEKKLTAN